jgi:transcriptional/translational regulatory protein YebC/TACO1
MAEVGAVSWQFDRVASFTFPSSKMNYDNAFELAIEAGAEDVTEDEDLIEIIGSVDSFKDIADRLHAAKVQPEDAGLRMIPKQEIELSMEDALRVMRVIEELEDMDDVQDVYSNLKMSEDALAALEAE